MHGAAINPQNQSWYNCEEVLDLMPDQGNCHPFVFMAAVIMALLHSSSDVELSRGGGVGNGTDC